ncbi:uncharacterized protein [Ptychodera flava]|uniref:uncharacterized protein n=1 Tax=Ptychodera flava TaxID=63121 RepID=UPI003969DFDA
MDRRLTVIAGAAATIGLCSMAAWLMKSRRGRKGMKAIGVTRMCKFLKEEEGCSDDFVRRQKDIYYTEALQSVADFVGAKTENLVFVSNTTTGVNCVLKSMKFKDGDMVLVSDLNYAAIAKTAFDVCDNSEKDLKYIIADIKFPIHGKDEVIQKYTDILEANPSIRVAIIDHITSATAVMMPIKELIQVCHDRGVKVVIDGAHAPGQVQLNLEELGADYYIGNLHKWLFTPRGSALLYVHPKHNKTVKPLVTSHNYQQSLQEQFYMQGTCDDSPYLCAPAAIEFYQEIGGFDEINNYCTQLISWAVEMLSKAWNTEQLQIPTEMRAPFMGMVALPENIINMSEVQYTRDFLNKKIVEIFDKYHIVCAYTIVQGRLWCRISANVYNAKSDYYQVRDAVLDMIQQSATKMSDIQ